MFVFVDVVVVVVVQSSMHNSATKSVNPTKPIVFRKAEEGELRRERERLKQLSIEEEEINQDDVERALRRTEKLLQVCEFILGIIRVYIFVGSDFDQSFLYTL